MNDLALVFNFMKMQDPESVVRESEFATAEKARAWLTTTEAEGKGATIPTPVKQAILKLQTGQRLLPEQRIDFINTAGSIFESQRGLREERLSVVDSNIQQFGLDRKSIIRDIKKPTTEADVRNMSDAELQAFVGK